MEALMLDYNFPVFVRWGFLDHLQVLVVYFRIAILAFHTALVDEPQDPLVVAAFSLALHNGGSLYEAIEIARNISQPHVSFHEIVETNHRESDYVLMARVVNLAASVKAMLWKMTDHHYVSQAMIEYPQAPWSDLVRVKNVLSILWFWWSFHCILEYF